MRELRFGLSFKHLTATVKAGRADVVTQVCLARGGLNSNAWNVQGIVRAVHSALGGRFFVLLNGHDGSLEACGGRAN